MDLAHVFLAPQNSTHRQYEALRAYFVDRLPAAEVAGRFGYTVGSLHQLAHQLRQNPARQFFAEPPRPGAKSSEAVQQQMGITPESTKDRFANRPISRWGNPEEIAWPVVFLASAASGYMTGETICIDGGPRAFEA